ncbi:MAG: hypothetical protein ACKVY0_24765 [Prosthecobacter sp.]|uniref:hypothetical protein n=1 Tax=Prosthecobacter sp. TaxID=1965333 RepID=UPI0039037C9F
MKREKLRRLLFVSAACLLSFPWLTPCVGIWSAAGVNGAHDSITKRDEPLARLPTKQLKQWAAKPGPKLTVMQRQTIPRNSLITEAELSAANGGRNAPRPGTLVGKGASAVVDGLTYTLTWVDPFTWVSQNSMGMEPTKPRRQLVLCESPFVLLEGNSIRFTRSGKNGPVLLARATGATVTVITPDGTFTARAQDIHFRGPSQEVLLEQPYSVHSGRQFLRFPKDGSLVKLNFVKRSVSCSGTVFD